MINRPAFKAHYRVHAVDGEHVVLASELGHVVLSGAAVVHVARLADGTHTLDAILHSAGGTTERARTLYVLEELEAKGYLIDGASDGQSPSAAFWHAAGVDARGAQERLQDHPIGLRILGAPKVDPAEVLSRAGLLVAASAPVKCVVTDDYLHAAIEPVNRAALDDGTPWLLVKPEGREAWLGPLFVPGDTGCWECLAHRLRRSRSVERVLADRTGSTDVPVAPRAATASTARASMELAAHYLAAWIGAGAREPLAGTVITLDIAGATIERHVLRRRPQCAVCGDANRYSRLASKPFRPMRTARPPAPPVDSGGHVDRITGAIAEVRTFPAPGYAPLRVAVAISGLTEGELQRPFGDILRRLHAPWSGKGSTDAEARASAIGEAVERQAGCFEGDEPRRRASFLDLGKAAIHPNAVMLFSDTQLASRTAGSVPGPVFTRVPSVFDTTAQMDWSPLWSWTMRRRRYLPTAMLFYGHPESPALDMCWPDSNGCAAGDTREDAFLRALLELVERDSVALWWYNRIGRPAATASDLREPFTRSMLAACEVNGRAAWVLDLTSDLGIPVRAAISRRRGSGPQEIALGFGADADPVIATRRAVAEMGQVIAATDAARDDPDALDPALQAWLSTATLRAHRWLAPAPRARRVRVATAPGAVHDDISFCAGRIEARGYEVLALDQSRPDLGLSVVRAVVPGLRHFWPRFDAGRLYEVPVRLGWITEARVEGEMNPTPFFL